MNKLLQLDRIIPDIMRTTSMVRYSIRDGAELDSFGDPLDLADRIETIKRVVAPYCWIVRTGGQEFFLAHENQDELARALNIENDADPGPIVADLTKIRVDSERERRIAYGPAPLRKVSMDRLQLAGVLR